MCIIETAKQEADVNVADDSKQSIGTRRGYLRDASFQCKSSDAVRDLLCYHQRKPTKQSLRNREHNISL